MKPTCSQIAYQQGHRQGIILILVTIIMVILAVLTTAFLTRMRNSSGEADEVIRLAQNRISLFAALTFIQEQSRLGYASMDNIQPWVTQTHREGHGWVDVRSSVPDDSAADTEEAYVRFADNPNVITDSDSVISVPGGFTMREHPFSKQIGPRDANGKILFPYAVRRQQGVLSIEVTNPGSGYTSEPTVTIDSPAGLGRQATARAVIRNNQVQRVEIIDPGWGYSSQPSVSIAGNATVIAGRGVWLDNTDWNNYAYTAVATSTASWPAPGSIIRVPFYRQNRPPFAVDPTVVRNPIPTDHTKPTFGIPFFNNPDPLPELPDGTSFNPSNPTGSSWRQVWAEGDLTPVANSTNLGWFRIYRETGFETDRPRNAGPAGSTFIITLGSGGTLGFRNWAEVVSDGETALFAHNEDLYDMLAAGERRTSYRVEWSGGVGGGEEHLYTFPTAINRTVQPYTGSGGSWYEIIPPNSSRFVDERTSYSSIGSVYQTAPPHPRNYIGTITYIQRLEPTSMPTNW